MHQIKRIIELQQQGRGIRQTVRLTGLSRNTIREYLRRISTAGLTLSQALELDEESLSAIVYTDAVEKRTAGRSVDDRYSDLELKLDYICGELGKRGVTKQLLWEEYRKDHANGYGYKQFCEYIKQHIRIDEARLVETIMRRKFDIDTFGFESPMLPELVGDENSISSSLIAVADLQNVGPEANANLA